MLSSGGTDAARTRGQDARATHVAPASSGRVHGASQLRVFHMQIFIQALTRVTTRNKLTRGNNAGL